MTPDLPQVQCATAEPVSIWKVRTFSSETALAFLLLSCSSAWCYSISAASRSYSCSCASNSQVSYNRVLSEEGESEVAQRALVAPLWSSIGLLLEGEQGQLVFISSAVLLTVSVS